MLEQMLFGGNVLLRNMIQKDPGKVVGPLASFFGFILNILYDFVSLITSGGAHTLGLAIILMTIAAKIIMLPLNIKSQKSMMAMQKLQPEMEKLKQKYGDNPDQEQQRKMSMEMNELYSKNKANPLMGCLPMFIQFPIFMALYYIMNQPYRFINKLGEMYGEIANHLMGATYKDVMWDLVLPKLPDKTMEIDLFVQGDVVKAIGKFTQSDWEYVMNNVSSATATALQPLLEAKEAVETFFGIVLTENTGFSWPSIMIPILCVVFTFLSSYISNKQSKSTDPSMKMQQTMMMFVMPIMMGFITFGMPAGVGLYWVTSNATQIIQQYAFNKYFHKKDDDNDNNEIVDPKPAGGIAAKLKLKKDSK